LLGDDLAVADSSETATALGSPFLRSCLYVHHNVLILIKSLKAVSI
jgi:hypothetical protein